MYPPWPELSKPTDVSDVLDAFTATATAVPLKAASEPGDGWRRWRDVGFELHKVGGLLLLWLHRRNQSLNHFPLHGIAPGCGRQGPLAPKLWCDGGLPADHHW